ncbi:MAG: hypothetical protein CL424_06380 [Acidimicrobiaceae bacterium]|nr:hypothetical protein [Acidimicrobiaceae bacterium]
MRVVDRRLMLRLVLLWLFVTLVRIAFSYDRDFFNLSPDEPSFLGAARWLSGTGNWHMFDSSTTRPGYSILLAPMFWLVDSDSVIRLALLLNAAIGGTAAVWLARLLLRITSVGTVTAVVSAGAVAVTPAALNASSFTWSEPLVTLVVVAVTWYLVEFVDGRQSAAFAAIAWTTAGVLVHGRLIPLAISTATIVVVVAIHRRQTAFAATALTFALAGLMLAEAVSRAVIARVWTDPFDANSPGAVLDRMGDVEAIVRAAIGQGWYLLASTLTVAAIGVTVCVESLRGRDSIIQRPRYALVVIAMALPLIVLSVIFVAGRERPDQIIYGRYNDAVSWTIVALGVAWTIERFDRLGRRDAILVVVPGVAAMMLLSLALQHSSGSSLEQSWGLPAMIAGVVPLSPSAGAVPVASTTLAALAVGSLLFVAVRSHKGFTWIPVALTCSLLIAGGVRLHAATGERRDGGLESSRAAADMRSIVPRGEVIGVRFVPDWLEPSVPAAQQLAYALYYAWELEEYRFRKDFGDDDVGPYVIAPTNDPLLLAADGSILWRDPSSDMALWFEPPPSRPQLQPDRSRS